MAHLISSGTAEDAKNRWATSPECFLDAIILYGKTFKIDVATEPQTAKCDRFIVAPEWFAGRADRGSIPGLAGFDALNCVWENDWWCNPPFDLKIEFIKRAREMATNGMTGMMLLPYEPSSAWFRRHVVPNATLIYEPDGRYQFCEIDGKTKKTGVNFASCLVLFTPHYIGSEGAKTVRYSRSKHKQTKQ